MARRISELGPLFMLIRCHQCQYANHVEADATKPRIVCARCATVISVEFLSNQTAPPLPDLFGQKQHQPESSFMKTPESPLDLDSLFNSPTESGPDQPIHAVSPATPSNFGMPVAETPIHSAENRWDGEEILEIPRASSAPDMENPLAIDDLLSAPPVQGEILEPYSDYTEPSAPPSTQTGSGEGTYPFGSHILAETQPMEGLATDLPSATGTSNSYEAVSPDSAAEETPPVPAKPSVFAQDSYMRSPSNTYVMAQPDQNNKGRLAKVFLAAALLFALLGVGYFALSGLIKDWLGARRQVASNGPVPTATVTTTASTSSSTQGSTASSPATKKPSASPSASASTTATLAASAKPSPSATATATPANISKTSNQNAANKPTPTPAATTGNSGHAVGAGDGSLAIQLASYKSAGEAQRMMSKLKSAGVDARMVKAEVAGKGTWFRVQTGRFTNEGEASKYAGELRAKGVTRDFIVTGYQNQ